MKNSNTLVLAALMACAGLVGACSSDGTGAVPPGAYGGEAAQFGGAIGTNNTGGSVASAGGENVGSASPGGATEPAGSPAGGNTPGQAGSTAITTIPSGGSIVPTSRNGGAGTTAPGTTATGGKAGDLSSGGTTVTGGTTGVGGNKGGAGATAGSTAAAGASAAAGSHAGGTTSRTGGTTSAGGSAGATSTGTGASNWWPSAFDANASLPNGKHNAGKACLSCHKTGGNAPPWLFGGTIYDQAGASGVGRVQVGIKEGTKFVSAYSASNGNIWLPVGSTSINWANAEIRIRNANGEETMMDPTTTGDCNSCHIAGKRILTP